MYGDLDCIDDLFNEIIDYVVINTDGEVVSSKKIVDKPKAFLSGYFNPLHSGHQILASVAGNELGTQVYFELAISSIGKSELTRDELFKRVLQFSGVAPLVLTNADMFYKKAILFNGVTFVVGWDTAVRIIDPLYYGGDIKEMYSKLRGIMGANCRFLVAGRLYKDRFYTLDNINIPKEFEDMFISVPEDKFRIDLSSTDLRKK